MYRLIKNKKELILEEQIHEHNVLKDIASKLHTNKYHSMDIGKDLIENESNLSLLSESIRREWIKICSEKVDYIYKSPDKYSPIKDINNSSVFFGYERCFVPELLEGRLNKNNVNINWNNETLLFSSAMSSLTCILIAIKRLLFKKKVNGSFVGSYFETYNLIKAFQTFGTDIKLQQSSDFLSLNISELDFILIEPVKYNFLLEVVDINQIINSVKEKEPNKLQFVIFDSTLLGNTFEIKTVLDKLHKVENVVVVIIRSLLKTDQYGFEFANAGLMELYCQNHSLTKKLKEFITSLRSTMGLGIDLRSYNLLNFQEFLMSQRHTVKALNNTESFFNNLDLIGNRIFGKVYHPSLYSRVDYSKSPFLFIELLTNEDICNKLILYLKDRVEDLNLSIRISNSFGFRNLSLEYIKTLERTPKYYLKIAPGQFKGVLHHLILEMLNSDVIEKEVLS